MTGRGTGAGLAARRRRAWGAAVALFAAVAARGLVHLSPARLRWVLDMAAVGTRPAGYQQTLAAMEAVTAVSRTCRDPAGCLPRAVATALLCRITGRWPTWRTGVSTTGSFVAHAWVEADGLAVGESFPPDAYQPLITVRSRPWRSPARKLERDQAGSR